MTKPETVIFSVDLEPNKDGTLEGVREAMEWFERTVPRGTVFTTYRIAMELPDLVDELAESFEIGVHVHPREFGHNHDQLAELSVETQSDLIEKTRSVITDVTGTEPRSFRAGRHSASFETLSVLRDLGFLVDASVNVRYNEYLSSDITQRSEPFQINGLTEVPVTYGTLPIVSTCCVRALMERPLTATASTLRADRWGCTGLRAIERLTNQTTVISFYIHPYDATNYHELENVGVSFRQRVEAWIDRLEAGGAVFVGVNALADS